MEISRQELYQKIGIYKITNKVNGKYYIGSSKNIYSRFIQHRCELINNKHCNKHLQRAWNKYGEDNFEFTIIEFLEDISTLIERESYWIIKLNSNNKHIGYNILTEGNLTGYKHTEETKKKLSEIGKGKKRSMETRMRMSKAQKGLKKSKTTPMSDETKRKLIEANTGKKRSEETIKKISKPIIQMDIDGNFIRKWASATEAGRNLNIDISSITKCCKGKLSQSKGFKWKYEEVNS